MRTTVKEQWALVAVAALLFVWTRPYTGIRHDGVLYAAQALRHLDPGIFNGDIFFRYGSQDSFSAFGRMYAAAVAAVGFSWASLLGVAVAQICFFLAVALVVWRAVPLESRALACLLVAATGGAYGSVSNTQVPVLHYAEPFLTGRSYAEILVVCGVALMLQQRLLAATVICAMAAVMHPLMALPGLLLCWLLAIRKHRAWLGLLVLAVPALWLAKAGVAPFDKALMFYDPEWRELVDKHNYVFMTAWPLASWLALAADLVLLVALAFHEKEPRLAVLLKALIAVFLLCVGTSLLGADVLSNVLITSLQLWRVQWICHLAALMFLAPELLRALRGTRLEQLAAVSLIYAILFQDLITGSAAMFLGLLLLYVGAPRRWQISPFTLWLSMSCLAIASGYNWWRQTTTVLRLREYLAGTQVELGGIVLAYLQQAPMGPLILALAIISIILLARRSAIAVCMVLTVLAVITLTNWDNRPAITKLVESTPTQGPYVFSKFVPADAEVYWQDDALAPWLLMHRRSYASGVQAGGFVFNRGTAIELKRRQDVTSTFDFQRQVCGLLNALRDNRNSCEPDITGVALTCQEDPLLRYIVMPTKLEGWALASWTPELEVREKGHEPKTYYLYECARLVASMETDK